MDYSNVKSYWNNVVNKAGKKRRDLKDLADRFDSNFTKDWFAQFNESEFSKSDSLKDNPKSSSNQLVYYDAQMCSTEDGDKEGQGIAITLEGQTTARFFYGFSMIATGEPSGGRVDNHQSAGFIHVDGETNAEFTVAGIGTLDTSMKKNGELSVSFMWT